MRTPLTLDIERKCRPSESYEPEPQGASATTETAYQPQTNKNHIGFRPGNIDYE